MIVHSRLESAHLAGNLLEDPTERDLFVYLPPGYEESDRRYPTAFLLHALGDSPSALVTPAIDGQRWRPPIEDVLDPVFGRMGVPPMIVVIPDGNSRYGCGQWVDSPVTGHFEQYVFFANRRLFDFADFNSTFFPCIVHDCCKFHSENFN